MTLTKVSYKYRTTCVVIMSLNELICIKNRIPCSDVAKTVCTVNLSKPVKMTSTDCPFDYKSFFYGVENLVFSKLCQLTELLVFIALTFESLCGLTVISL